MFLNLKFNAIQFYKPAVKLLNMYSMPMSILLIVKKRFNFVFNIVFIILCFLI